jgi:hypothetical protein
MDIVEEPGNPMVSRFVMDYLNLQPGPVTSVLLVCVHFCLAPEEIFHALHTVKSLATAPITYIVNTWTVLKSIGTPWFLVLLWSTGGATLKPTWVVARPTFGQSFVFLAAPAHQISSSGKNIGMLQPGPPKFSA